MNTIADGVVDPQAIAAGAFVDMPAVEGEEPYRAVATPVDFEADAAARRAGAAPGEHTAEMLAELGYAEGVIAACVPK